MIKSQLIQRIAARNPHLHHGDVERIVNVILNEIVRAMKEDRRVELRGFGAFSVRYRKARMARNPRTGKAVPVGPKKMPYFRAGKELRERLNAR